MKRFLTLAIAVAMTFSLTACMSTTETVKNQIDLTEKGLSLISEVDKLSECEEYTSLYSASPEIAEIISKVAKEDYSQPKAVYIIENLDELVFKNMAADSKLPTDIKEMVRGKFAPVLPSQINAMNGAMAVAATSILSHGDSFIYEGLPNISTYLYTFDNGYSFMVTFSPNDKNIVNATVSVVISDDLAKCTTEKELLDYFKNALSFEDVSVSVATEK